MRDRRGHSKGRMARLGSRARSRPLATLIVANTFPIAAAAFLIYAYRTGKIAFLEGSERIVPGLVLLAVGLAVLVFLSWVAAPLLMPAVKGVGNFIRRQRHEMSRGGISGFVLHLPFVVAGLALYAVLWINVLVLACLMAVNVLAIVACVVFLARDVMSVRG